MVTTGRQAAEFTVPTAGGEVYNDIEPFTLPTIPDRGTITVSLDLDPPRDERTARTFK